MLSILKKEQNTLFLLLIVFSLYSFVHNQLLYNPLNDIDSQTGLSFELNYEYSNWNSYYYKAGRAPFYIVNRWVRDIFHPVVATTIFTWGYIFLSALPLFIFLYRRFNSNTAFLVSLLFLLFPAIIVDSKGPDYYCISAGLCFLWSLVFFQSAQLEKTKRKQALFYGVSGGFYALCFWVFIPYIFFIFLFFLLHWEKYSSLLEGLKALKPPILFMGFGIIGITVFFGLVNYFIYGRSFFFPLPLFMNLNAFTLAYKPPVIKNFSNFYINLGVGLVFLFGILYVWRKKIWRELTMLFFYIFLIFYLENWDTPKMILHTFYYLMFLTIGIFLYKLLPQRNFYLKQKFMWVGIFFTIIFLSMLFFPDAHLDYLIFRNFFAFDFSAMFLVFLLALSFPLIFSYRIPQNKIEKNYILKIGIFILLFVFISFAQLPLDSGQVRKDYYLAYLEVSEYLRESILTRGEKRKFLSWGGFPMALWHPNRLLGRNIAAVAGIKAVKLERSTLLNPDEQSLRVLKRIYNQIHGIVVVDVNDEKTSNAFMSAYASIGIGMTKKAQFPYRRGEINWNITILRFQKD